MTYLSHLRYLYPHLQMAIVTDIDDSVIPTTVQKHPSVLVDGATGAPGISMHNRDTATLSLMRDVLLWGAALGYRIVYLTARPDIPSNAQRTHEELIRRGLPYPSDLYLMPANHVTLPNFSWYKFDVRQHIHRQTPVVLNVGDQWTDLFLMPPFPGADPSNLQLAAPYLQQQWMSATSVGAPAPPAATPTHHNGLILFHPVRDPSWVALKLPHVD